MRSATALEPPRALLAAGSAVRVVRGLGTFDLAPAPLTSNTGREIPVVTIGDGPTSVMYVANQHGNEYVVSEAMLNLILTGAEGNTPPWRRNYDPTCTTAPCDLFYDEAGVVVGVVAVGVVAVDVVATADVGRRQPQPGA